MLKSIEGKLIQNDSEKDAKRLRRSAEKGGRKSARGTRSKDPTPRQPVEKKEREGTTEVPLPTPVPTLDDSQKGSGKMEGDSTVQPGKVIFFIK